MCKGRRVDPPDRGGVELLPPYLLIWQISCQTGNNGEISLNTLEKEISSITCLEIAYPSV